MKIIIALILFFSIPMTGQWVELSDEFDKTCDLADWINIETTEGWVNSHLESYDVNVTNTGRLTMIPWTTAWFASRRSNLLYKDLSGDFVFTSEVTAMNKAGNDQPSSAYSLAGLMIRTPKVLTGNGPVGDENYVFLSIGTASNNNVGQFEVKNTVNSNSSLNITNIGTTTSQIRMVRVGGAIVVLYRLPGGQWQIRNRYNRSDMPTDVQVGFVTYTDWDKVNTYSIEFHNANTINADLNPDPSDDQNQPGTNTDWNDVSNWNDGVLPTSQDSILIPNCGCPEVVFPNIDSGVFTYSSLIVEEGGQLNIETNAILNIDLIGNDSQFSNYGTINNSGTLSVINSGGKLLINEGFLYCAVDAICNFEE